MLPSVEFGLEIRNRTKVMVFQTIGGKCGGKASDNHHSGKKHRANLIFGTIKESFELITSEEFGLEIRTRTKVMVFLTNGGKCGGNVGEKLLT
jgi:hypothetical protein